jgi:hypothetical protein
MNRPPFENAKPEDWTYFYGCSGKIFLMRRIWENLDDEDNLTCYHEKYEDGEWKFCYSVGSDSEYKTYEECLQALKDNMKNYLDSATAILRENRKYYAELFTIPQTEPHELKVLRGAVEESWTKAE